MHSHCQKLDYSYATIFLLGLLYFWLANAFLT